MCNATDGKSTQNADTTVEGGVSMIKFINCFEVPAGRDVEFLALWREVNAYMAAKPGYLSHKLHRSLAPEAVYRFVNVVEWQSPEHWEAAHDSGFRALVSLPEWADFTSTPSLYEVVHEGAVKEESPTR
jgi:heme-degrading monooxygenase HmoA